MARKLDLTRRALAVSTLIDVGVSQGTPELYSALPHAYLVLVEPLVENEPDLRAILKKRPGEYLLAAAGASDGRAIIHAEPHRRGMSSMLERTAETATGDRTEPREVPVLALDGLLDRGHLRAPFGLKIDTEGFELEVVRGAQKLLEQTTFVIAETSVGPRFEDGYRSGELLAALRGSGLVATDFLKSSRAFVDVLFERLHPLPTGHR